MPFKKGWLDEETVWNTAQPLKNEFLLFAAKWSQLETIVQSEIRLPQKDMYHMLSV